jgi:citrate lyase subunit beta / citryl-CoA lyase
MTSQPAPRDPGRAAAVAWLFVPGDRPERFTKAVASGADAVILDLEDAVAPSHKDAAREQIAGWLSGAGRGWVRINAAGTPWYGPDVAALAGVPGLLGLVVPKSEDPDVLRELARRNDPAVGILSLVESALGVHRAVEIASSGAVDRLAFGSIDFAEDVGADGSWEALLVARGTLVLASRIAGLTAPVDGVTTALRDPDRLAADVAAARRFGFAGKLCIHPDQVRPVQVGFAPTEQEVVWAERILAAAGDTRGAVAVDGAMVDRPVLARAQRILDQRRPGHVVEGDEIRRHS